MIFSLNLYKGTGYCGMHTVWARARRRRGARARRAIWTSRTRVPAATARTLRFPFSCGACRFYNYILYFNIFLDIVSFFIYSRHKQTIESYQFSLASPIGIIIHNYIYIITQAMPLQLLSPQLYIQRLYIRYIYE